MKALDKDGDGKLSEDELKKGAAASTATPEDQLKALDKDGDGLTPEELQEAAAAGKLPPAVMRKLDKDGDGVLSPEEAGQGAAAMEAEAAASSPKEKLKKAMKEKFKSPKEALKAMDKDGDGKLSPDEMKAGVCGGECSPEQEAEVEKMMKEMAGPDGKISGDDFYKAAGPPNGFTPSPGEPGYVKPKEPSEAPVTPEEMKNRLGQAFKNGKDAWDKISGGKKEITLPEFKEKVKDLGIPPGEAEKLFKQMDKDGSNGLSEQEFQNMVGVEPDEVKSRFVEAFPSAEDALKAADADGDGKVSPEELEKVMAEKLGLSPENTKKAAAEMMKKMAGPDGKISGDAFKDATKATAADMAERIAEKPGYGSAGIAFKKWDKNGDGK